MNRAFVVLLVTGILLSSFGCLVEDTAPVVQQPVLEQSTTAITQYDYKAGAPNDYSAGIQRANTSGESNPYLPPKSYPSLDSYFPQKVNNHYTPWMGGWGYYWYAPAPVQPVMQAVFWTGNATITVEP